jgi:hypothetical protein
MIKKAISLVLGSSLVLAGLSIGEEIVGTFERSVGHIPEARAATSTGGQTLTTSVQAAITLTLATGTVPLGNLTPGTPIFATTSASIDTNNATGLTLQVNRNSATSTLLHTDTTTTFPDYTAWNGSNNSTTTNVIGANLHFKVANTGTDAGLYNSTFWGPNDTDGASNARYAGFPSTSQTIASNAGYVGSTQTVVSRYRMDAPATQKTGSYSGGITYTAFSNP